jgi:hypothetical protein
MPSLDPLAEQSPTEIDATTEAAQRLPTDAAPDSHSQHRPLKRIADAPWNDRGELAAMLLDLQTNRSTLRGLTSWYGLFVFTGGDVPTAQWDLAAMTSCLEHPLAADCPLTLEIQRYRHLIQTLSGLGQPGIRPRTLRCRHDLGDKFRQAASEIRVLTDKLESSVTKAMEELQPPST